MEKKVFSSEKYQFWAQTVSLVINIWESSVETSLYAGCLFLLPKYLVFGPQACSGLPFPNSRKFLFKLACIHAMALCSVYIFKLA